MVGLWLGLMLAQAPTLADIRGVSQAMERLDAPSVWAQRGPGLEKQFGSAQRLSAFFKKVAQDFGPVMRVASETITPTSNGGMRYQRHVAVAYWARGVLLEVFTDKSGRVDRLAVQPAQQAAPSPHLERLPQTTLRVPFSGTWSVLWGGDSWHDNRHASVPDQRFALDLLMWAGNRTFSGKGTRVTDYPCWNREVVSPASGVVVSVVDGIRDNDPHRIHSVESLYGNHIVVDHQNGEFSLLGHLRQGSTSVKVGQRVMSGQVLGATGNSGMSTEPHLHYQLMDHADWRKAHGMPVVFSQTVHNGYEVSQAWPRRGDTLAPSTAEARLDAPPPPRGKL